MAAVIAAVVLGACTGGAGPDDRAGERSDPPSPVASPVPVPSGDPTEVRLDVGDDFQAVVDANPPGSTYLIASGIHRMQQVIPHDGDRFVGEPGAVMNGSRVLSPQDFQRDTDGRWFVPDQTQEGLERGVPEDGTTERTKHSEDVFVDGDTWLVHVDRLRDLRPGTFFFDYDADRIYLGDDPTTFESIETSVTPFAFGGTGVRGVVIEDLIIEKYATPHYFGAVGGVRPHHFTHDWTVRHVEIRLNHGGGVRLGPGMTLEHVDVHHNGQIGLTGDGVDESGDEDGYTATVTVRDSRIHHNNTLGFRWTHEAGGTKFKDSHAGSIVERNWVHDNAGPGLWWDDDNADTLARDNLVEDNAGPGLFYEISTGDTLLEDNVVLRNGVGDDLGRRLSSGISISNSDRVTVRGNHLRGNARGITVTSSGEREPAVTDVLIERNVVVLEEGWNGMAITRGADPSLLDPDNVTFARNRYFLAATDGEHFLWGEREELIDLAAWLDIGQDVGSTFAGVAEAPAPPRFRPGTYGPRWLQDDADGGQR